MVYIPFWICAFAGAVIDVGFPTRLPPRAPWRRLQAFGWTGA